MAPYRTDPFESAWDVVLARSPRGEEELKRAIIPLSRAQQYILTSLDGTRSLRELIQTNPELKSYRLSRDCARLLAFGLVKTVRGELPRELVVDAMNLTVRVPAAAFRPAAVEGELETRSPEPDRPTVSRGLLTLFAVAAAAGTMAWWLGHH